MSDNPSKSPNKKPGSQQVVRENSSPSSNEGNSSTKTVIKTNGREFKNLMKELLKELIQEGFFNNVLANNNLAQPNMNAPIQPYQDPRVNLASQIGNQIGKGNKVLENVFVDTMLNTVPAQAADPYGAGQYQYAAMQSQYQPPPQYYQQPPIVPPQQYPQAQYGMPQQNPYIQPVVDNNGNNGMMNQPPSQPQQQPQYMHQHQSQYTQGPRPRASHWANLAFNKPISNRPSSANTLALLGNIEE